MVRHERIAERINVEKTQGREQGPGEKKRRRQRTLPIRPRASHSAAPAATAAAGYSHCHQTWASRFQRG